MVKQKFSFYKIVVSTTLDHLDSETWHIRTRELLHLLESSPLLLKALEFIAFGGKRIKDSRLKVKIDNLEFENPFMVGAGWDKEGRSIQGLYSLGFAGVEIPALLKPQPGNPKPRQFIIGRGVVLQHLGFNTPGAYTIKKNLSRYMNSGIPLGIGLAKNKDTSDENASYDYAKTAEILYNNASYFVINVSSPNTPGLKRLQGKKPLTKIVKAVIQAMEKNGGRKPLFVKVAPEITHEELDDVIKVVLEYKLTGIIAVNTWANPDIKAKYGEKWRNQPGGVSGNDKDYRALATKQVAYIYNKTKGKIVIIGVGGIQDLKSALDRIQAGASLIQIVAGIRGEGPSVAANILKGLVDYMDRHNIQNIKKLVGKNVKKYL